MPAEAFQGEGEARMAVVAGVDFGTLNEVDVVQPEEALPRLPVARAVWLPRPNLKVAAAAWIYAGGAHHTSFSQELTAAHLEDLAEICRS